MSSTEIERLHYFQRQYLGAADFTDEQEYHCYKRRRHNVGPHTWGIVAGLELVEVAQPGGGGTVDVYILPGMAVDGFGREITVLEPQRLEGALFEEFRNQGERFLPVWIAYDEEPAQRENRGLDGCGSEALFGRVRESYRIVIDPDEPYHEPITVAGHEPTPGELPDADVEDVSQSLTVPRDESVPHQEFPGDEEEALWMVRLGNVHWNGTSLVADDADPPLLNQDRSYLGAVVEQLLSPQGKLVIRHRWSPDPMPEKDAPDGENDEEFGVQAEVQGSLTVDRLVEAKADLHVQGRAGIGTDAPDAALHVDGGEDAALADGTGYLVIGDVASTNLVMDDDEIQARDSGSASTLQLQAEGGELTIHQNQAAAVVSVSEDGNLGLGTLDPKVKLQIEGGADAAVGDEEAGFLVLGSPSGLNLALDDNAIMARNGGGTSELNLQADGGDVLVHDNESGSKFVVKNSGRVGVGTSSPNVKLHVRGGVDASLASDAGFLVLGDVNKFNVVFDNNEIMARNDGNTSPLHFQADGGEVRIHNNLGVGQRVVVRGSGSIGVGTVDPKAKVHVEAGTDASLGNSASGFLVLGDVDGKNLVHDTDEIMARNNGGASDLLLQADGGRLLIHGRNTGNRQMVVDGNAQVGIGTAAPLSKLDVRGTVRATFFTFSDAKWKKNVEEIENPLERLGALRGVRFEWRREEYPDMGFEAGLKFGFLAQEIESVFPELVHTAGDDSKSVDVFGLVPVLVGAVKELVSRCDTLTSTVEDLEQRIQGLSS